MLLHKIKQSSYSSLSSHTYLFPISSNDTITLPRTSSGVNITPYSSEVVPIGEAWSALESQDNLRDSSNPVLIASSSSNISNVMGI